MLGYNKGWFYFATRYCDGKRGAFGWETKGATNLKELQKVLRENFMIRRLKKFVETQLPEKVRKIIYLDSEKYKSHLILEANALEKFSSNREKAIENIINGASVGELADIRKKLGMAKLPDAIEYINNVLESVHKVVIFARHRDVINKLYQQYSDMAVKVMGGMSDVEKDESVQRFQTDVDVRVFIGAVEAAGVGLTLTAAHKSIFVEFDWTPGKILQCEDRLHRINQKNIVECDYLVVDSSLDAYIIGTMIKKNFVIDTALN
jgi:SWI/SNF-related matrix-associated actin-dependent regulator 1 of chromatin subfamily A